MGGLGALTIAMKNPAAYKSVSAFAPISNPTQSDWGRKQLSAYLGDDESTWSDYDPTLLMREYGWPGAILVDQGTDDQFLDLLKPEAIWEIERGLALSGRDIQRASTLRSDWYRAVTKLFESYHAFVLPTAQCFPFPIDWHWPREVGGVAMDTYHRWMEVVVPVSLIGLPAIALPMGGPRPMGLQIAGRRGDDQAVLQLGEAWHRGG